MRRRPWRRAARARALRQQSKPATPSLEPSYPCTSAPKLSCFWTMRTANRTLSAGSLARIGWMLELSEHEAALARVRQLAAEQAALRRVATLVAGNAEPAEVFRLVCAEVGSVLGVESTNLTH